MLLNAYRLRIADNSVNRSAFKTIEDSKMIQIENFLMCYMGQSGYNQIAENIHSQSKEYFYAIGTFTNHFTTLSNTELKNYCYALVFENAENGNIEEMYYITDKQTLKHIDAY